MTEMLLNLAESSLVESDQPSQPGPNLAKPTPTKIRLILTKLATSRDSAKFDQVKMGQLSLSLIMAGLALTHKVFVGLLTW